MVGFGWMDRFKTLRDECGVSRSLNLLLNGQRESVDFESVFLCTASARFGGGFISFSHVPSAAQKRR